jgi:hypothetical protein
MQLFSSKANQLAISNKSNLVHPTNGEIITNTTLSNSIIKEEEVIAELNLKVL